jgi:hypothetical protein
MTKIEEHEVALLAIGIQFCEVSMRGGLSMAQTVDRFLTILNEYYEDDPSETTTNVVRLDARHRNLDS